MSRSNLHRALDAPQALVYGVLTVASGGVTLGFSVATAALVCTGVGAPLALITFPLALSAAAGTTYVGSKTVHKTKHVFGARSECHALSHAGKVITMGMRK